MADKRGSKVPKGTLQPVSEYDVLMDADEVDQINSGESLEVSMVLSPRIRADIELVDDYYDNDTDTDETLSHGLSKRALPGDTQRMMYAYRRVLDLPESLTAQLRAFLVAYSVVGNVSEACELAKMTAKHHYTSISQSEIYRDCYAQAQKLFVERLEREVTRRAIEGWDKPVVSAGKLVCFERVYDTKLMEILLKANAPEKYRDRIDVTSGGQSLVKRVVLPADVDI